MGGGSLDNGFGVRGLDLAVLGQAPEVTEPGEGALDHPALGQQDKALSVPRTLDYFHVQVAMAG